MFKPAISSASRCVCRNNTYCDKIADTSKIEELKAERNLLHSEERYREAYDNPEYSEAIKLAPNNAIFYYSRASASHVKE